MRSSRVLPTASLHLKKSAPPKGVGGAGAQKGSAASPRYGGRGAAASHNRTAPRGLARFYARQVVPDTPRLLRTDAGSVPGAHLFFGSPTASPYAVKPRSPSLTAGAYSFGCL